MRNRISCSAGELGQLNPEMVESVVGGQVFKIGNQYFSDQRVNIIDANGTQIVAEVNGTYGVYAQTIKLRGGTLSTKCSCPSTEQPFCRHCVAVLLHQFHNGSGPAAPPASSDPPPSSSSSTKPSTVEVPPTSGGAPADVNFREATLFIDWFHQAVEKLGANPDLPPVPESLGGLAREWAKVIDRVNQQYLESEEERQESQALLQSAEGKIETLTKDLTVVTGESKSAQANCRMLEQKVQDLEKALTDFGVVSKERDRLVSKVSTMQSDLQAKGAELESVSMTLKSLSKAIRNLLPSDPPS